MSTISRLLIEAILLFLKGISIVSLVISAAFASMYLFVWLGPVAICAIFSVGGGFLIGWKLGEKKRSKKQVQKEVSEGRASSHDFTAGAIRTNRKKTRKQKNLDETVSLNKF